MNTKLTLRLDDHLIESVKEYSAKTEKSVSKIVSDFFEIIKNEKLKKDYTVSPAVKSLRGILDKSKFSASDYKDYLEKKYL
ncbi:MAG: antitoxin [Deltaproteobacteria bacterium]|nr:antitoxin [Deltaproteobacteria bacterium]